MKFIIFSVILLTVFSTAAPLLARAQTPLEQKTFLQTIAGNWEGTLEYLDYSDANKRVKLKTYLTVTLKSADGSSAEFATVYDDAGRIVKDTEIIKIDLPAKKYSAGESIYSIESVTDGKIILLGSGQDGEKIEPIRKTITFAADSLAFLKETRVPWQFRNQLIFKRAAENALAKRILSPASLQADFEILKNTLTIIHPGVYRYQSPERLEKISREFESKLNDSLPEGEFVKLISQFVSAIRCGHTFANPFNQNPLLRERIFGGKTYLPFYFRIVDGKIIVTENASSAKLARGSEITKINGTPAQKIIAELLSVTKGDGENTLAHRIQSIELTRFEAERYALFDWYFPLFFPFDNEKYTIEAKDFSSKRKLNVEVSALTKAERTMEMSKRYGKAPTYDDGWKFEIQNDGDGGDGDGDRTAYLKIENSITWRLKKIKFKEFLANAFAEMRARSIKHLIIDLRGNDGGDSEVGFELAKYLAKTNLPPYIASRRLVRNVAPQPELLKFLDTYSEQLKNDLKNGLSENIYKKSGSNFFEILPNENVTTYPQVVPDKNNFQGEAYIISDASNASAAFQFLNYARENRLARIVGQATGGNRQGINGGNYFFLTLPNSKIEIDVPVYYFAPLISPQKDESVVPDVSVRRKPEDIGNDFDREMFVVRQLIKKAEKPFAVNDK